MSKADFTDINDYPDFNNDIAIIGMNGRFPGAANLTDFWDNLERGVESVKFFKYEELKQLGIDAHLLDNPHFVAADAVLADMDMFDAEFFDYSVREAEIMDPQHRLFLESAWEVMEQAGYCADHYDGKISVYGSANLSGYMTRNLLSNPGLAERLGTFKIMIANGQDFLATKVSYKMNLTGSSVNVNTLCSSSMVALHYACQELLNYGCDIALAGGVSFQISRNEAFFYQEGGIGSADGHCRAFDKRANGTVSGSGLAMVVLKRLEDALAAGDQIYAVVKGTGINNDGAKKNSFTAPNVDGQAECIAQALAMSGVDPETISYIEAHGTGTDLGDPIEIAALTKAFRAYTDKKQFCGIGSVKTNIGHLVNAGGMASLIKTVLSMSHGILPASLNFAEPNPKIDFIRSPFFVNKERSEWKTAAGVKRRAGVSSFGIGGTNVHTVIEEAPPVSPAAPSARPCQLICLSAKTESALTAIKENLLHFLVQSVDDKREIELADAAFTLQVGRRRFPWMAVMAAADIKELIGLLRQPGQPGCLTVNQKQKETEAVFRLVEQDAWGTEGQFRRHDRVFDKAYREAGEVASDSGRQFAALYALATWWKSFGIEPGGFIATGVGVYAAAAVKGLISPAAGLALSQGKGGDFAVPPELVLYENEEAGIGQFLFRPRSSYQEQMEEVGTWWTEWGRIDWPGFYRAQGEKRNRILLPTYPFERKRFWIEEYKQTGREQLPENRLTQTPRPALDSEYAAPRNETEEIIVAKWEEVLGYEQIGIHDNFFELGGHSLIAAAVAGDLSKIFGVQIPMQVLFEATTVAEIAEMIHTYQWAAAGEGGMAGADEADYESGSIM